METKVKLNALNSTQQPKELQPKRDLGGEWDVVLMVSVNGLVEKTKFSIQNSKTKERKLYYLRLTIIKH